MRKLSSFEAVEEAVRQIVDVSSVAVGPLFGKLSVKLASG